MSKAIRFLFFVVLGCCLAACRTYPKWNSPSREPAPKNGYYFENTAQDGNSDSLFVVLTFSGGGTRAAALAYGVMEKLAATPIVWEGHPCSLLDEVDIISSVSGGSLTSAYYGVYGDRIFQDFPDRVLYTDLERQLFDAVVKLGNYARLASPFFGRTDLMAEQFNDGVFANKTYSDIQARGRRPYIIVNATDLAMGLPFTFTQSQFDLLASDLSGYPVGSAVAASAAFPGVFTPLTLRNYASGQDVKQPEWVARALRETEPGSLSHRYAQAADSYRMPDRRFIHLADGGVSDNLGLMAVVRALRTDNVNWSIERLIDAGRVQRVVIITVNAQSTYQSPWGERPDVLDLFSVARPVSSIPIGNFAQLEMEYLRLLVGTREANQRLYGELEDILGQEEPDIPHLKVPPQPVEYTLVEVSFDRINDKAERQYFETVPTRLRLPRETVDRLRSVAGRILDQNPHFNELVGRLDRPGQAVDVPVRLR